MNDVPISVLDPLGRDVRAAVAEALGLSPDDVRPDATFEGDLQVDSLRMIQIGILLETRFGLIMPGDMTPEGVPLRTVQDLVTLVRQELATQGLR